jgi:imidazolonepropionase-like amidohydrolase
VAFQSDADDAARGLPLLALHAVERGLSADAALAALTVFPSRMYKLDDRVGSIFPGRDGDILIFDGHPFEAGSRLMHVIVNGREVRR